MKSNLSTSILPPITLLTVLQLALRASCVLDGVLRLCFVCRISHTSQVLLLSEPMPPTVMAS